MTVQKKMSKSKMSTGQQYVEIQRDWQTILWHVLALLVSLTALIISIVALVKVPVVQLHPDTIAKLNQILPNLATMPQPTTIA